MTSVQQPQVAASRNLGQADREEKSVTCSRFPSQPVDAIVFACMQNDWAVCVCVCVCVFDLAGTWSIKVQVQGC